MTEFQGNIWAVQDDDEIFLVCTTKPAKNKIQAVNEKGRELRVVEDKLLWRHSHIKQLEEWQPALNHIQIMVESLRQEIDVVLLWETARELQVSEVRELTDLYFGKTITPEHLTALWRVLAQDRLYFKRRGKIWEARTPEQVQELKKQREREQIQTKSLLLAEEWLQTLAKSPSPYLPDSEELTTSPIPDDLLPFVERLECWLHGDTDKAIDDLVSNVADSINLSSRELVFEVLQKIGRLPADADRDVIVAGLKSDFSVAVNQAAMALQPWSPNENQAVTEVFFSIDDEETREVDDAVAIVRENNQWKLTIAISDPTCVVQPGDVLDREAMRRGTTVYLPTQTVLMLPERISCDIASLTAEQVRSSIVIRAWVDDQGQLSHNEISREAIKVLRRLDYNEADRLLSEGQDETAQQLRDLLAVAQQLRAQRIQRGAFNLQHPEYKISVENGNVTINMLDVNSQSHQLVAEMMILANHLAAAYGQQHRVPLIYRTQEEPLEPITLEKLADPLSFYKVRKLLRPSTLSLEPAKHSGLGLTSYTQLTSPLRRFADLVMQRQLVAHIVGEPLPYDQDELFKVLATAERTARDARRFESEAKRRWLMYYLKQSWGDKPVPVLIIESVKGHGYKVEMQPWGVEAFLGTPKSLEIGTNVITLVDKVRIKAGTVRLKLL